MRNRLAALAACLTLTAASLALAQAAPAPSAALAPDTSWVARSILYEVNVRDFSASGDLRGVTAGLGRVQAAGADVVWLMPVQPPGVLNRKGSLGSPYGIRDYGAIDSAFGTQADFRALVRAAHARGLNVILDWVPDHTAWDNVWVAEHPEYYVRSEGGALTVPRDPEGKPTDWTDVVQLDYRNPGLRRAMIDAMRSWLVGSDLDGFRVDVAGFIPDDFWREATAALRAAARRPILLLAEAGELKMHRLGFDLSYGWDTYSRLKAVFRGAPADTLVRSEVSVLAAMPPGGMRMRFTTNHDETAWDNPPVTLFGGAAQARAAYVAIALLPGRPLLYDGQEVESPQKLRLFERDVLAWDQPHAAEARAFYRAVEHLAHTDPSFIRGAFRAVGTSAPADVIAYARGDAAVFVNPRSREIRVAVTDYDVTGARDLLTGRTLRGDTLTLPAYGAMVLARRSPWTGRAPH